MKKTRILWSGITGRTGINTLRIIDSSEVAEIVAGVCRNDSKYYNYNQLNEIDIDFDVIVDFSHKDSFDKVLDFALRVKKPLITGTSGINEEQLNNLEQAAKIIPIFRGGNFRFEVEKFINSVVDFAKDYDGKIKLV